MTLFLNGNNISVSLHDETPALVFGALLQGSAIIKLMFTVWISIHLFALAVFQKNLQKLESFYVVSSLIVPLAVTSTLLGLNFSASRPSCLIDSVVYSIIFAVLVFITLLIVGMGTILCYRACRRRSVILSEYDKQHKKALYEMLPLLLYPIFFLLFTIPIFVNNLLLSSSTIFGVCSPLWSFTTSLLLIFHLCVVRHVRKKTIKNALAQVRSKRQGEEGSVTVNETTKLCNRSDAHFTTLVEE